MTVKFKTIAVRVGQFRRLCYFHGIGNFLVLINLVMIALFTGEHLVFSLVDREIIMWIVKESIF